MASSVDHEADEADHQHEQGQDPNDGQAGSDDQCQDGEQRRDPGIDLQSRSSHIGSLR
jgi:hypothetical protein